MLNLVCYVSLCEGLRVGAGSLSYIVHVDCCGLSTIVIKKIIIIIIITLARQHQLSDYTSYWGKRSLAVVNVVLQFTNFA